MMENENIWGHMSTIPMQPLCYCSSSGATTCGMTICI